VADENRLAQILLNLADNAIKFTETGSVAISIESPVNGHWSIIVRDTGRGIREEDQDRIFEEFHQLDYTVTEPKSHGTGLGLAITRHLAEQMRGEIKLDSQIGKGSEFKVTLPLKVPEKETQPALVSQGVV
jgi:signal transduction histidine kinase